PLYGAILWSVVIAILFLPLFRRVCRWMHQRRTLAALATVIIIVVIVIIPLAGLIAALVQEASGVYERIQSGDLNFARYFQQVIDSLPGWAKGWLDRFGLSNLGAWQGKM